MTTKQNGPKLQTFPQVSFAPHNETQDYPPEEYEEHQTFYQINWNCMLNSNWLPHGQTWKQLIFSHFLLRNYQSLEQHVCPAQAATPPPRAQSSSFPLRRWRVIIRLPGNQTMLYFLPERDVIQVDPWVTAILLMWVRIWGPIWCHQCWTWGDQMECSLLMSGQLQLPEV